MKKVKIGIAGVGYSSSGTSRGKQIYNEFRKFDEVEVVAVMDPNDKAIEQFQERHAVERTYTSFQPFIQSGLDAVFIASPLPFHSEQSVMALNHNVHVLSEVTAATSIRECAELLKAAKESEAFYMMAENYIYIRENKTIKNMVDAGLFGDLYYAEGAYLHNIEELYYENDGSPTWRKKYMGNKKGLTYGTHSLGPILEWLDDQVCLVNCLGTGAHMHPDNNLDDSTTMMCKTKKGALLNIRFDISSKRPHNMAYYTLQGTKGCYEAPRSDQDMHKVWLEDYSKNENEWTPLSHFYSEFLDSEIMEASDKTKDSNHWGADYFMIKDFIQSMVTEREPSINIYKSLDMTMPGIISEESILSRGIPIKVPDAREW
ncbi:Gfo/Idh/MocA family protein [Salibacterium aidingense]|uniref:Gfo/Idh/MocA family protein n=1 Tax=Salibacterium aidingense TaxID=384933 RepID=UPI003BBB1263